MRFLLPSLLALIAIPCFADCPSTRAIAIHSNYPDIVTTASQLDTVVSRDGNYACVQFDLSQGSFSTCLEGLGGAYLMIAPQDDFVIQGLPAGTPVALTVKFSLHTVAPSGSHPPSYHALVGTGPSDDLSLVAEKSASGELNAVVSLSLNQGAGEPFRLHFLLEYYNGFSWNVESGGTWTFEGLPLGASFVSCH